MLLTRQHLEEKERELLAPYASLSANAAREHHQSEDKYRTAFQRDVARIIHSKSFRRLKGKTQVFVAHHGDHFRNRLSHSLEVSQISRSLARNLALNEDLAEAIALAHDLGHTPFGHTGEEKLNEIMHSFGSSFEHNRQSHRILTQLEKKYPDFSGLNMTRDLLDGLSKHQSSYDQSGHDFDDQPSLEAQIVNLADEIAYTNHDIDDGLRAGIFEIGGLEDLVLWREAVVNVDINLPKEAYTHRAVSALIELLTRDLLESSEENFRDKGIDDLAKVRKQAKPLVIFSDKKKAGLAEIGKFLKENFYYSSSVVQHSERGAEMIEKIFFGLIRNLEYLPAEFSERIGSEPEYIIVADFVAGMTDGYAEEFSAKF